MRYNIMIIGYLLNYSVVFCDTTYTKIYWTVNINLQSSIIQWIVLLFKVKVKAVYTVWNSKKIYVEVVGVGVLYKICSMKHKLFSPHVFFHKQYLIII